MKRIALSCAVVVAGSLAAWAAFPVVYVSQYKDADGNPYYEGAPEGAAVYATLAEGYANVESKGTIWVENDFVCNEGKVSGHGYSRLVLSKVITLRSRSEDWRTGAEIHGYYSGSVTAEGPFGSPSTLEVPDGGRLENVRISGIDFTAGGVQTPILIRLGRRHENPDGRPARLENVVVENVKGRAISYIASSVTGVPGLRPQDITIRNVDFLLPGGGTAEEARRPVPESERSYPDAHMFDRQALPAYGFYVRHADNVRFENAALRLAAPDARERFVYDDVGP